MKTQMTAVMTMVAAFAVGAPAAALDQATPAQTATTATRAAEKAQQAAREALAAADAAQTTVWSADVQKAIAAAQTTVWKADVQQALETAREATTVWGPDIQRAMTAASDAATMWQDMDLSHTLAMAHTAVGWEPQSDRDREASRAQREKEDAAREAAREKDRVQRDRDRENSYYDQGQSALDSGRWDRAVSSFDRVVELKGNKADAALYWKAYAQNKLGQRPEALATINQLVKDYPKSRYLSDARALEVEAKGGQANAATETDEDMKLMILNNLANSGSDEFVPMLQKLLQGTSSPRLKSRALFVLAQSNSPKAREVLVNIAKGGSNPDL